ncbi:putative methyltransferase-domain-containing protein [Infundibulicybe gibba]|nr:putative methyltransferase-domain-containing protein [Infundibulicybe gibba]
MYFYLSFLRPPPQNTSPTGFISITPQIANDLRTELCDATQDIYYTWFGPIPNDNSLSTPRMKLTTWRPSGAYKELRVPLPRGARAGQSWRLGLTCTGGFTVGLDGDADAFHAPLPVLSMPILLGVGAAGKQEQVERIYTLPLLGVPDARAMRIREQTSFDLDKKVWDSGVGLSSWLCDIYKERADIPGGSRELGRILFSHKAGNVLELGSCGNGIVSTTLAALRSSIVPEDLTIRDRIITTDLPSAMPLLHHNISANRALFTNGAPEALILDWDDELPALFHAAESPSLDLIIMADVTYNTTSFPALIRTLFRLITADAKSPLILLGYKERDAAERTLWDLAREIGVSFYRIGERTGREERRWKFGWVRLYGMRERKLL